MAICVEGITWRSGALRDFIAQRPVDAGLELGAINALKLRKHSEPHRQKKVDTQWKLFCLVHNIEKLAHHGYGQ